MRASPLLHLAHARLEFRRGGGGIAVETDQRLVRKQLLQRLLDPLGALADGFDRKAAALAALWQRLDGAAVMAAQFGRAAMHRQARIAVPAGRDPAADRAQQRGRVAAAIDEDQHLCAGAEVSAQRLDHRGGQPLADRMRAQVDERQPRRLGLIVATRQRQPLVAAAFEVVQRLESRRGRSEHHRDPRLVGARHAQIARRVAAAALVLLVGAVMFLVDDDQPESWHAARTQPSACRARCARGPRAPRARRPAVRRR